MTKLLLKDVMNKAGKYSTKVKLSRHSKLNEIV